IDQQRGLRSPRRRVAGVLTLVDIAAPSWEGRLWNCVATIRLSESAIGISRLDAADRRMQAWTRANDAEQLYRAYGHLAIEHARLGNDTASGNVLNAMQALENPHWSPRRRWEGPWRRAHVCEFRADFVGCATARRAALAIAESSGDDALVAVSQAG